MIQKIFIAFIFLIWLALPGHAQNFDRDNYIQNLLPPSPGVSALQRYNDFPIDYSTGIPNISYPLYTIDVDGFKIPITLSYHAGGIKVDDIGTAVGLGWTLQAGGGIFRQINGLPDETANNGFLFNSKANAAYVYAINAHITDSAAPQQTLAQQAQNYWDLTQDNYTYNFVGNSGAFYFNKSHKITLTDKCNLQLKDTIVNSYGSNGFIFSATDDKGNQYAFNNAEFSTSTTTCATTGDVHGASGTTDWMLTRITTPAKRTIDFNYTNYATMYTVASNDLYDVKGGSMGGDGFEGSCQRETCHTQPTTLYMYNTQLSHSNGLPQSITADNISIQFVYSNAPTINWQTELDSIKIYNSNKLVRIIHFNYSVFNGDARLKLVGFQNIGVADGSREPYQFSYYDGGTRSLPPTSSRAKDMFGYYNGANTNSTLIYSTDVLCPYHANRDIDTVNVLNGTLNRIILPTGGTIDYTFEANYLGSGNYFGGVRLKKLSVFDPVTNAITTESYQYQNAYGVRATNGLSVISQINGQLFYQRTYFGSNNYPINQLGSDLYAKIGYLYKNVIVDKIASTGDSLRTVYQYNNIQVGKNVKGYPVNILTYNQVSHQFNLVKNTSATYVKTTIDSLTTPNYALGKGMDIASYATLDGDNLCCYKIYQGIDSIENFSQSIVQKTVESDTLYTSAGKVATTHNYSFANPAHIYCTQDTHTGSDTLLLATKYKYPMDMIGAGLDPTGVYQDMVSRNMVSPVITTEQYKNGTLLTTQTTQYRSDWFAGKTIIAPSYIQQKNAAGQSQGRLNFLRYDSANGKLLQLAKDSDVNHAYIYDYKNSYLVGHAVNASASDIAATSFEADGKGNFSFTGTPATDANAFTGSRSYPLSSGSITKTGLSTGVVYTLSYWSKTGSATVNSATTTSALARSGWNYFQHTLSGITSVTISGSVTIDELRFYPQAAQLVTYTFDPLIGMNSQTSPDNRTSYYEYDGLGRALVMRDQDRNVLKKWKYQYQANPGASPTIYANAALSRQYAKNNCGGDSTGSKFTYTVPGGTYTSSISQRYVDSLAQRDTTLNGQAIANSNGSCSMIYYNVVKSKPFTRNNCAAGYTGSTVTYTVAAKKYANMISQAYVDSLAQGEIDSNGQANANTVGVCTSSMKNVTYSNSATAQMTIVFTNTSSGTVYTFNLPHTTGSVLAGQIVAGTYNVTLAPTSANSNLYDLKIGTYTQSGVNSMSLSNISISANITVLISNHLTQ